MSIKAIPKGFYDLTRFFLTLHLNLQPHEHKRHHQTETRKREIT